MHCHVWVRASAQLWECSSDFIMWRWPHRAHNEYRKGFIARVCFCCCSSGQQCFRCYSTSPSKGSPHVTCSFHCRPNADHLGQNAFPSKDMSVFGVVVSTTVVHNKSNSTLYSVNGLHFQLHGVRTNTQSSGCVHQRMHCIQRMCSLSLLLSQQYILNITVHCPPRKRLHAKCPSDFMMQWWIHSTHNASKC